MNRPTYISIAAVTIDGKIALHSSHPSDWTSKEDKDFLHKILDKCDAVLVGNSTYKMAKKPLSKRNCIVLTRKVKSIQEQSASLTYVNPANTKLGEFIKNHNYKSVAVLGGS